MAKSKPDNRHTAVGELITRHREARGITQSQLARGLGVRPGTISRVEAGLRGLNAEHVGPLSAILGIEGDELVQLLRLLNIEETVEVAAERGEDRRASEAMRDAFRRTALVGGITDRPRYLMQWIDGRVAIGRYRAARADRALESAEWLARTMATVELYSIISLDYADALILASKLNDAERIVRERCLPVSERLLAEEPASARAHMAMARTIITNVNAAYNRGDEAACWHAHRRALPHLRAAADHYGRAKSLFFLALFRFWQGELQQAERSAGRALQRAHRITTHRDYWWDLRDAFAMSRAWWEVALLALLIDIDAAAGRAGTQGFNRLVLEWTDARRFWVPDLPPFTPRYLWLETRETDALRRHRKALERWLRATMTGGCWNIHTDLQIVYGDFLRWADPDNARAREAGLGAYRMAREIARTRGFALHLESAERRLASDEPPFPGLAR